MVPQAGRVFRLGRLACALIGLAGPASAACRVEARASVPLMRAGALLLVPVEINGTALDLLLDTGAERSVIGLAAADRLKLARDEWVSTDIQGAGGRDRRRLGRPASLALGGIPLRRNTVAADNSVVVGPVPDSVHGHPIAGLLGEDFLSPFDIDIDPAAGTLTLYTVTGCAGRFLPWSGAYAASAADRPVRNILTLPMRVGAVTLTAELDTGAERSLVSLPGMVTLGLAGGGGSTVRGFGPGSTPARLQRFASVQIGATPAMPAELLVAPVQTLRSIGALVGADWIANRRVWVSWSTNQIFSAPP